MINKDLFANIEQNLNMMSKGQRRIANYITDNYEKAAFLTASRLGEEADVSESTVVRFAIMLGYDGYPALQKSLQELTKNKLTTLQRLDITSEIHMVNVLSNVLKSDMMSIKYTLDGLDQGTFLKVVEEMLTAKRVFILGVRSASLLVEFMGYYLNYLLDDVHVVTSGVADIFEQLIKLNEDDVLIGISFARYATRTLEGMEMAKRHGAKVIAITDSEVSPLCKYADISMFAPSETTTFVDSLVSPLSLINALVVAISINKKSEVTNHLTMLEKIWDQYDIYQTKK